jgi:cytochrome c-type biogenesis protein CcmH
MMSTSLFWLFAVLLSAATLAVLVRPLVRKSAGTGAPGDESAATAVFRDHKRQLDADRASGALTAAEHDLAQKELLERFGSELASLKDVPASAASRPRWLAALAMVIAVPVVALALYAYLGNPTAPSDNPHGDPAVAVTDPKIVAMIDALAERMKANPEDGAGWALLARSYMRMGRFNASASAFEEAAKRVPDDPSLLADWADVLAQTQGAKISGKPLEILNRALAIDPNHLKSLALLASEAMERGDRPAAIAAWQRLRAQLPPGSDGAKEIDGVLAELGAPPGPGPVGGTPAPAAPLAAAKPPVPAAAPTAPVAPAAGTATSIDGQVELDPKLRDKLGAGDILFIFARAPSGSRMPLAVVREPVGAFPRTFSLNDAMAMAPGATISAAKSVVIEARVSKGGGAVAQPGDLSGVSAEIAPGARNVRVVIDRVMP